MYSETGIPSSLARFCNSRNSARVSLSGITDARTSERGFGGLPIRILIVYQKVRANVKAFASSDALPFRRKLSQIWELS
jgi:hypothetical protein